MNVPEVPVTCFQPIASPSSATLNHASAAEPNRTSSNMSRRLALVISLSLKSAAWLGVGWTEIEEKLVFQREIKIHFQK